MPVALNTRERQLIQQIVVRTRKQVNAALKTYTQRGPSPDHQLELERAAENMAQLLANVTDGKWYNAIPWEQVEEIFSYGQMAADLLRANSMTDTTPRDTITKLGPGRFKVTRELHDGKILIASHSFPCTNPAFGFARLDEWQAKLSIQRGARVN